MSTNIRYLLALVAIMTIALVLPSVPAFAQTNAILYPKGGEVLPGRAKVKVSWMQEKDVESVSIRVWDGMKGTWSTLAENLPGTAGEWLWSIPAGYGGDMYRLEIIFHGAQTTIIRSEAFFAIAGENTVASSDRPSSVEGEVSMAMTPNPVKDLLRVNVSGLVPHSVRIISATSGAEVAARVRIEGSAVEVNIGELASGTYILEVMNGRSRAMGRFVVVQ